MRITWLGRSCFHIATTDGLQIVTDPYCAGMGYPPLSLDADIVSVSHSHDDHNNLSAITGEYTLLNEPGNYSLHDITVRGINTFHDAEEGAKRGRNVVFVYTIEGLNVCHCGDLGHIPNSGQLEKIGHVDILLMPVGGYYTLSPRDSIKAIAMIEPTIVIPMHYRLHPGEDPIQTADEYLNSVPDYESVGNYIEISASNIGARKSVVVLTP